MLDVDGAVDIDAGVEQFHHVLPAPFVAAAGRVAMRELIDQRHRRLAREQCVDVEFVERACLAVGGRIFDALARQQLQAFEQGRGFRAAVGFHQAHDHVDPTPLEFTRTRQHGVGLAHARRRAEEHGQPAAGLALQFADQGVGLCGACIWHARSIAPTRVATGIKTS